MDQTPKHNPEENKPKELIEQEQLLEARLAALEARSAWQTAEATLREAAAIHPRIQPDSSKK